MSTKYPLSMTEAQAAEYLGMSRTWLRVGRSRGNPDAPPYIKVSPNGGIRYLKADLDRWIEQRRIDPRQVFEEATR